MKTGKIHIIIMLLLIFFSACKEDPTEPDNRSTEDVNNYLQDLPSWSQFSPTESSVAPMPMGDPVNLDNDTLDVETINDSGDVEILPNVVYRCQSQPYTMRDNPQQIVMYNPNVNFLWPGGFVQGKSYRDGIGSINGLIIDQRSPIQVSIPDLANNDNFRTVDTPTQAEVAQAIGSMVGNATQEGLATPSKITFEMKSYHSESQFALSAGISGRYMGFEASATGDLSKNASETTITAHFYQQMYTVTVAPPSTPGGWFNSDFTQERLDEQIALGRIGPDNLPVYISQVVYGRMMMFSFTSTANETDIRATLNAAYNGIGGGGSANLSTRQKSILQESKIAITSIGGDADATIAMIRSGNWADYFTDTAPLTSAAPLSYTFSNLGDNSDAKVTEATEYNITTCAAIVATPGTFSFQPVASHALRVDAPATTLIGDIDGDDRDDLIWNHVSSDEGNQTYVGFSSGNGLFTYSDVVEHPVAAANGWGTYEVMVADINGDDMDDLVWNHLQDSNYVYIGFSNGDGTFNWSDRQHHPVDAAWNTSYKLLRADLNNDNSDDLVWNIVASGVNRTYVAISNSDGTFDYHGPHNRGGQGWGNYDVFIGDVNADGRDDLIWNILHLNTHNRTYWSISNGDGTFDNLGHWTYTFSGWETYNNHVGDIDGDGRDDMIFNRETWTANGVHRSLSDGTGLNQQDFQNLPDVSASGYVSHVADVNGDGRIDLVFNKLDTSNETWVGLGSDDGTFDFSRVMQQHPEIDDWTQFDVFFADINDDGRDDIIWNHAAATNKTYVGLGK